WRRGETTYAQLPGEEDDEDYANGVEGEISILDLRIRRKHLIEYRGTLALFLLFLGCLLLLLTVFIFTGHMEGIALRLRASCSCILTFLPGFYETRIAYYSWRGAEGYRFAAIPSY
ncbi:LOW QUALITY PROTEIN: hypothetical protein HID58_093107, partial [Brassica napus]